MTFWQFLADNKVKLLGGLMTLISTATSLAASGGFDGLLSVTAIKWLGVSGILIGAAITGAGFNNSSKEKIAAAMETAIKATPPEVKP